MNAYALLAAGPMTQPLEAFLREMEKVSPKTRVTVMQIIEDHFCPRCGRAEVPGGCQCTPR